MSGDSGFTSLLLGSAPHYPHALHSHQVQPWVPHGPSESHILNSSQSEELRWALLPVLHQASLGRFLGPDRISGSFWKPAWCRQGVTFFRTQAPPGFSLGSIKNQTPVTHQAYKPSELTCMQGFSSSHSFSTQMQKFTQ